MKQWVIGIITILFLVGCKRKSDQQFYEILNDHFLMFTDTVACKTGSFFLIPGDTAKYEKVGNIIEVDTFIHNDQRLIRSLSASLAKSNKAEFVGLLSKPEKVEINLSKVIKIGQYQISPLKLDNKYNNQVIGKIWFSNFSYNHNNAIIFVSKQSSPKSGVSTAYLFKKDKDRWEVDTTVELERW